MREPLEVIAHAIYELTDGGEDQKIEARKIIKALKDEGYGFWKRVEEEPDIW